MEPWFYYVLYYLGASQVGDNPIAMALWAGSEGMPAWENNWLATTKPGFGGYPVNSVGVMAYPDMASGVEATVTTLLQPNFAGIVNAFRSDAGLQVIWEAINNSDWCRGCQGGRYPEQLANAIAVGPPAPGPTQAQASGGDGTGPVYSEYGNLYNFAAAGASWISAAAAMAGAAIDQQ